MGPAFPFWAAPKVAPAGISDYAASAATGTAEGALRGCRPHAKTKENLRLPALRLLAERDSLLRLDRFETSG